MNRVDVRDPAHPVRRVVVIACMPRSGSTLLGGALVASGVAPKCDEMLNTQVLFGWPRQNGHTLLWVRLKASRWVHRVRARKIRLRTKVGRRLVLRHLDLYPRAVVSADGVLATKQFWHLFQQNMIEHGLDMGYWGVPVSWVRLVRNDRLAQAISYVRAEQSGVWTFTHRKVAEWQFDDQRITATLQWLDQNERSWDDYFTRIGESPLLVEYRDLDERYDATMRRILDHFGFPHLEVAPPQLERQRDQLTDAWMARYRELHPEYRDPD